MRKVADLFFPASGIKIRRQKPCAEAGEEADRMEEKNGRSPGLEKFPGGYPLIPESVPPGIQA